MSAARRWSNWKSAAQRAGVTIIKTLLLEHAQPAGPFDLVLVDAPCSGTGTWRRQPELRWRLTAGRLAELTALQDRLLDQAAGLTAPAGGWSMPPVPSCRWRTRTGWRPSWPAIPAFPGWTWPKPGPLTSRPIPGLAQDFRASPALTGTDGFYCAGLRRE